MRLIVCLEDHNGLLFNKRRLSSDRILCQKICSISSEGRLWMNGYSAKLFEDDCGKIYIDENFAKLAQKEDYCFFESPDVNDYATEAEEIIVFRWNRRYPFDVRFSESHLLSRERVRTEEFAGNSHKQITMEVYR